MKRLEDAFAAFGAALIGEHPPSARTRAAAAALVQQSRVFLATPDGIVVETIAPPRVDVLGNAVP